MHTSINSIFGYAILLIVYMSAIRAILSIPRFLRHMKAQTALMIHIAERLGLDGDTAKRIYYEAEGKTLKNGD